MTMTEVQSLRGTTVAEIFSSGLENLDRIEAIAVSVLWKDGQVTAGCSNTTNERMALLVLALDEHQRQPFRQG
jgi:hypothetical protein